MQAPKCGPAAQYPSGAVSIRTMSPSRSVGVMLSPRSDEHTSELPSLMRISYAVFCLKKKIRNKIHAKFSLGAYSRQINVNVRHQKHFGMSLHSNVHTIHPHIHY